MIKSSDILSAGILIVDDNHANVILLEQMLQGAGYDSVTSTHNPSEVCELHRKNRYSLILLDLQMPGMDGFEVMEQLKKIETGGYLPVLAQTSQPNHKIRALRAGARDFVSKPLDLGEVLLRVHNLIEVRLLQEEAVQRKEQAEALTQQTEESYRSIIENAPIGIYQSSIDHLIKVNPALATMFGFESGEEMVAWAAASVDFCEQFNWQNMSIREPTELKIYTQYVVEFNRKDNSTFTGSLRKRAVRDESGGLKFIEGFVEDITERRRVEEKLRESEQKFRQLAENIKKVFWICDNESGRLLYVSPAYEQIWGRSRRSLNEQPMAFVEPIHPEDRARVFASLKRSKPIGDYEEEYRIIRPDGSVRWIRDRGFAVRDDNGEIYRVAGLAEDTTERRQLEEELRRGQKMEAIGRLAGGIAHDFNNILAATLMQLTLLQQTPEFTTGMKESLKEVENETMRAVNLTRQLLMFSQRYVAKVELLDLNELVNDLLKMLLRLLGENIKVEFQASTKPVWVRADKGMMEQVVMNLCINARDAMPKGGQLKLSTAVIEFEGHPAVSNPEGRYGCFVCLSVTDTGCGMDESVLKRIFEPFYTTKEVGKGTGLGLSTVYGVVKQHAGWVEVDSEQGRGSSFRVYLSAQAKPLREPSLRMQSAEIRGGSETILMVEDDHSLRRTTALWLRKLGYAVLEASNGVEARKVWAESHRKIDLLLSDMVMPEKFSGLDLAQQFSKEKASLKIIISSGYSADLKKSPSIVAQEIIFLPKPYPAAELAKAVRGCLDGIL